MVFPENTRDDIVPAPPQSTFLLSQEVPGGYESNVLVFRKKFIIESLIASTTDIEFVSGVNEIRVTGNAALAQILSRVLVGQTISISGASEADNNGNHLVLSVDYTTGFPDDITFTVASALVDEDSTTVSVGRGFDSQWETLQPETDYTIGGVFPNKDREITFSEVPQEEDEIYVVHRGAATYNLVPTNNSVGPDQLSQNLRNFVIDRFDGDGVETQFTLSQEAINTKTLLVTVDGEVLDGDDPLIAFVGDWDLIDPTTIEFASAPDNGAKIRVLHLGFSTVSRRASLSSGQVGAVAPNSITQLELSNGAVTSPKILDGAVIESKIANDNVTSAKILLDNNQPLRGRRADTTPTGLLRIDGSNRTVLQSDTLVRVEVDGSPVLDIDEDKAEPVVDNVFDLGSPTNKFKEIHAHLVNGIDLTTVGGLPAGTVVMTALGSAATGWLLCRGQAVSRATFATLFAAIGTTFGPGDGVTTFNLPDLRQRIPIGQTDVAAQPATNLAAQFGSINHTHGFAHVHDAEVVGTLPNHIHSSGGLTGNHPHTHKIGPHRHNFSLSTSPHSHIHAITALVNIRQTTGAISARGLSATSSDFTSGTHNTSLDTHTHTISGTVGSGGSSTIVDNAANNVQTGPTSTPTVTITGNTGNPTTSPSIVSTGTTVSQSTSTTGTANPPCLVLNFMIKT